MRTGRQRIVEEGYRTEWHGFRGGASSGRGPAKAAGIAGARLRRLMGPPHAAIQIRRDLLLTAAELRILSSRLGYGDTRRLSEQLKRIRERWMTDRPTNALEMKARVTVRILPPFLKCQRPGSVWLSAVASGSVEAPRPPLR
jgi:hypothetical protein